MKNHPIFVIIISLVLSSCSPQTPKHQNPIYQPGLGEIMSLTQMRHTKLGLAGVNENWDLAAYEFDELKESFDDVIAFHPTHKKVPQPLTALLPAYMNPSLDQVQAAIAAKHPQKFVAAYDVLTISCNNCHQASNVGFIVIQKPELSAYTDQDFRPRR